MPIARARGGCTAQLVDTTIRETTMTIYDLNIKWLSSTETVTLDVLDLPQAGMQIATFERWDGLDTPVRYLVDVLAIERTGERIDLTLGYDPAHNGALTGVNEAWGQSRIVLDMLGRTATATWTDRQNSALYNGVAKVKVNVVKSGAVAEDFLDIAAADPTTREAMVLARLGQGAFRAGVIAAWNIGECCALTKIDVRELLVASHIKAWHASDARERLDPANGLLLATHVDKLFDRHLLSFERTQGNYVVRLHPRVAGAAALLQVQDGMTLDTSRLGLRERHFRDYMAGHFACFKEKCGT
jgi:hypothetical protein